MTNYLNVKNKIRDVIVSSLEGVLSADKIFYATERFTMPEKPYILITELSNNEDLGSGRNEPSEKLLKITQYKETIFTIAIYGLSSTDLSDEHNLYRTYLQKVRNDFELAKFNHYFKKYFTIQSMTDLRPLSEENDTGFTYRYEFDVRCGYNEIITSELKPSQGVIIDLEENNIHIEVDKENIDV